MVSAVPTVTTTEVIQEPTDILKQSIKVSNRLSQVMDHEAKSVSISQGQITPPHSEGTTPSLPPPSTTTTTTTITPGMTEFDKSIDSKNLKEKAESETFIRNFAAKQQGEKLLSVTDPWFVNLLAEFRAEQAVKMAAEKESAAREMEELLRLGGDGKKMKVKRGKGFKGWVVSIF